MTQSWWIVARPRWKEGYYPLHGITGVDAINDLELAWRQIFGVSRDSEVEVERFDGGEDRGTLIRYQSGRCAAVHHYGNSQIRIIMRGV